MAGEKAGFIPFNAINEFMRTDFRTAVIQLVFDRLADLDQPSRKDLDREVKRLVSVPGFRNSASAPAALKSRSAVRPFEKHASFTASILQAWSILQPKLRGEVHELLTSFGWTILPENTDRSRLPGFLPEWPAEDFATITSAFRAKNTANQATDDDICLMAVWLSGRLPVKSVNDQVDSARE